MTNWPLVKRRPGSRVVRKENRLSVQCWTQVTVSTKKAPLAFSGGAAATETSFILSQLSRRRRRSDVAAHVGDGARGAGEMYPAFGLLRTRPAAGAHVRGIIDRLGAGPAADGGEALGDQRVRR